MMKLFYRYTRNKPGGFYKLDSPISFSDFSNLLSKQYKLVKSNKINEWYGIYLNIFNNYPSFSKTKLEINLQQLFNIYPHNTNIKFWLSRGYEYDEAASLLKERQSTFSIKSIMKTFNVSENEANEIFNNRKKQLSNSIINHPDYELHSRKKAWLNIDVLMTLTNPNTGNLYTFEEATFKIDTWRQNHSNTIINVYKYKRANNIFPIFNTNIQYYLNKGYDLKTAKSKLRSRQQTRTLENMIRIYGEIEGQKRYDLANSKYVETMNNKSDEEKQKILISKFPKSAANKFYSNSSFKFFKKLKAVLIENNIDVSTMKYGDKEYYLYSHLYKRLCFYDCKIYNILIEYNGSHVHPNKNMPPEKWNNWKQAYTKQSADEVHALDQQKIEIATSHGNEIYVIWDIDDEDESIEKLLSVIKLKGNE